LLTSRPNSSILSSVEDSRFDPGQGLNYSFCCFKKKKNQKNKKERKKEKKRKNKKTKN